MKENAEKITLPEKVPEPVSVVLARCKSCKKCVRACPAGVLSMKECPASIYGIQISVDRPDLCVGCGKCDNACPDFAISVLERTEFAYPKLSKEAKDRQARILANKCMFVPVEEKK